jgi:hypothetical protein
VTFCRLSLARPPTLVPFIQLRRGTFASHRNGEASPRGALFDTHNLTFTHDLSGTNNMDAQNKTHGTTLRNWRIGLQENAP